MKNKDLASPQNRYTCGAWNLSEFQRLASLPTASQKQIFFEILSTNPPKGGALKALRALGMGFFERVSRNQLLGGRGEGRQPPKSAQIPGSAGVTILWGMQDLSFLCLPPSLKLDFKPAGRYP